MKINEIKRKGKAVGLAASLILCAAALAACGGNGEAVDLSAMTAEEQAQLEQELTEELKADGVKLLVLYNTESETEAENDADGDEWGEAEVDANGEAWDDADAAWDDADGGEWNEADDGSNDGAQGEDSTDNGDSVTGVEKDVPQRYFAIAVAVEPRDAAAGDEAAKTVSYNIYDLAEGLPGKSTRPLQKISAEGYAGSDPVPCDIRDLNFDGARDISLRFADDGQNAAGAFFLWDEAEGRFVEQEEMRRMISPTVKEEYKIVQEHISVSEREYTDDLYRWEGNDLVPARRILQRAPNANSLQGEVYDWYDDYWEPMYERKILVSPGEWTAEDYEKAEDLAAELADYYDPDYIGW